MDKEFNARVDFYRQCVAKGYTDMSDETQSLKAKVIAMDLGLSIKNIDVLFAQAKADYESAKAAEEKRLAEEKAERARLAVKGEWVMTVYNYAEGQEDDDKKDIAVYRRPDGSIYYTVNDGNKNEGCPAFSADPYKQVSYTYNEGKVVYTGARSGGISMGGTHTVGPSMSERWSNSGNGRVMVKLGTEDPIWIKRAKFPAVVAERFHRERIYTNYIQGDEYPLMASYTTLKKDSELLTFMAKNSSQYSHYDRLTMRSNAVANMLYSQSNCNAMVTFLGRVCRADYPETDAVRYERIAALPKDANSTAIQRAIEELTLLAGYTPADELQKKLRVQYEEVLQREKEAEVLRREQKILQQEKKRAKLKKILPFIAGAVIILIIAAVFRSISITSTQYKQALELLDAGDYEEAIAAFEALGGYKDSAAKINECNTAILDGKYNDVLAFKNESKYAEALEALADISEHKDAKALYKEISYLQAEAFLSDGQEMQALMAFRNAGDFRDAQERCAPLLKSVANRNATIDATQFNAIALRSDGTVVVVGADDEKWNAVSSWTNIVAISAGDFYAVGLKADGTVVAAGDDFNGRSNVLGWTDIVSISAGDNHVIGLKSDGTVVAAGSNSSGQCDVSAWTNIVAVSAGGFYTIGLKSDGTVVAAGSNSSGGCNVSDWTDIIAVSTGNKHTLGLKADGTVVAVGSNGNGECDVSGWTDIVSISASQWHTAGLKADGTVVAVGSNGDGQCDVSEWSDIVFVVASDAWSYTSRTIGLKANGTVVCKGEYMDGLGNLANIKLPE